jgi:subtilase family serine protease
MKKLLAIIISVGLSTAVHMQADPPNFVITGNTPTFIQQAADGGAVDPSTLITITVWLKLHNQAQLDALVRQQQQVNHANYHRWLTQTQFNTNFGASSGEANAVRNFLRGKRLTIDVVAENNMYIRAYGTVGDIQNAFHVSIHSYTFGGKTYRSNTADPAIADASGAFVAAIMGLDDVSVEPAGLFYESYGFRPPETHAFTGGGHTVTFTGNRYGPDIPDQIPYLAPIGYSPNQVQTAYNLSPLYAAGYDGSGQTIVIIAAFGSPSIQQDAALFSQIYGLAPVNLQVVRAPGLVNSGQHHGQDAAEVWAAETTLDVEWSHAIAPGANVAVVLSAGGYATLSGLFEAINYAVVHHVGNTISNSWGYPEHYFTPAALYQGERIFQMAAAQGIDVNAGTGDYGDYVVWGLPYAPTVIYPASSAYGTAIGGTTLALNPDNTIKFQTGYGHNLTYIAYASPSGGLVPDDNVPQVPLVFGGFSSGSGGGASHNFAKPSFQSALPGNRRLIPDISWLADEWTGVEIILTSNGVTSTWDVGGTSLACPMFSGLMAIAAQKAGHPLGQAAPLIYNLPAGTVTDIVPVGSPTNVTGIIDGTPISADQLVAPLSNTSTYYSALFEIPPEWGALSGWMIISFGTDSSLAVTPGWDNVTGVGTPNPVNFVNAIAQ